jgi:hypothetical protein
MTARVLAAALAGGIAAGVVHAQVPASIAASAPKRTSMTEAETIGACQELKSTINAMKKDGAFMAEPFAGREVHQMQKVRDSLHCPDDEDGLTGAWIIDSPARAGYSPLKGRMTLKRIDAADGIKRSQENWGSFTLRNECAGAEEFYLSDDLTWDPGSFILKDYMLWAGARDSSGRPVDERGSLLMCNDRGHFEGRFRAHWNEGLGEAFKFYGWSGGTLSGSVYPMQNRGPSDLPFVARRGRT